MATVITGQDMDHMTTFPLEDKVKIMKEITSRSPVEEASFEGSRDYVDTILKLRDDGLKLIDLQPQRRAFTTIWYGETRSLLGLLKSEVVAMVVWEFNGGNKNSTTLRIWHI